MAIITITEYATTTRIVAGLHSQVPLEPPLVEQAMTVSASSSQCAAFNPSTTLIRIAVDGSSAVAITFGTNPTATTPSGGFGSGRWGANQTEYRGVQPGGTYKLAAITTT